MKSTQDIIISDIDGPIGRIIDKELNEVRTVVGINQLDLAKCNLKDQAKSQGGNAVVRFRQEIMPEGRSILVYGKAVILKEHS